MDLVTNPKTFIYCIWISDKMETHLHLQFNLHFNFSVRNGFSQGRKTQAATRTFFQLGMHTKMILILVMWLLFLNKYISLAICLVFFSGGATIVIELIVIHKLVTGQKYSMTGSNFVQLIIQILNLMTQLDDVSLFYENIHI